VVIGDEQAAISGLGGVDDSGRFTIADSHRGAFKGAAAALDAVFRDFISQGKLPLVLAGGAKK
jgi:hypothetical protein